MTGKEEKEKELKLPRAILQHRSAGLYLGMYLEAWRGLPMPATEIHGTKWPSAINPTGDPAVNG